MGPQRRFVNKPKQACENSTGRLYHHDQDTPGDTLIEANSCYSVVISMQIVAFFGTLLVDRMMVRSLSLSVAGIADSARDRLVTLIAAYGGEITVR